MNTKYLIAFLTVASLLLASCTNNDVEDTQTSDMDNITVESTDDMDMNEDMTQEEIDGVMIG
jgi:major membrane immunogen (membrane-anchored lipoprotein)